MIAKAEYLNDEENPRYVVTTMSADGWPAQRPYEEFYCARRSSGRRTSYPEEACTPAAAQRKRYDHTVHVGGWTDPAEWVEGRFDLARPGACDVRAVDTADAASADSEFRVIANGRELHSRAGRYALEVRAVAGGEWKGLALQAVKLTPR